jgi:hypothetical protein
MINLALNLNFLSESTSPPWKLNIFIKFKSGFGASWVHEGSQEGRGTSLIINLIFNLIPYNPPFEGWIL